MDNESDPGRGRRSEPLPAGDRSGGEDAGAVPAGGWTARRARAAGEVSVPIWGLPPEERATLLRILQGGGRADCWGPARDHIAALLQAGYLAPYDEGTAILTPAALRAIAAEVDRRAASDAGTGEQAADGSGKGGPAEGAEA